MLPNLATKSPSLLATLSIAMGSLANHELKTLRHPPGPLQFAGHTDRRIMRGEKSLEAGRLIELALACIAFSLFSPFPTTFAAENKVLELDGHGSYVQLPPRCFTNLNQATIEGWMKWKSFRNWSRF